MHSTGNNNNKVEFL